MAVGKVLIFVFFAACFAYTAHAGLSPDLTNPPSNMVSVPAGAYVIPMDGKQLNSDGTFNVRAYGLAVALLWQEVPIFWAIKAGKLKDGNDFSARGQQVYPTSGTATNYNYAGGPLIIFPEYVTKANGIISGFQSGKSGVVVHKLLTTQDVDIRHSIFTKPKVLLSNLSGFSPTLSRVLAEAGLVDGTHYSTTDSSGVIKALGAGTCYTLFAEPHYVFDSTNGPSYYGAAAEFVQSGGNFYCQCAGLSSYENYSPAGSRGGFLSIAGVYIYKIKQTNLLYPNPDTPFAQFIGTVDGNNDGVTPDWCLNPPSNIGSTQVDQATEQGWFINNGYFVIVNNPTATKCKNGQTRAIAAVAKPGQGNDIGGLVMFMGAHDWSKTGVVGYDGGKRVLLNAVLTPAKRADSCGFNFCPAGQSCPAPACKTCQCSAGGSPVYTAIPNCCVTTPDCGSCKNCVNGFCSADCGDCAACTNGVCGPAPCSCTQDSDCIPCYGCDNNQCLSLAPTCCTSDADCGACQYCDTAHQITQAKRGDERSLKPFYICQDKPNCCQQDSDCGSCYTCTNNVCRTNCNPCQTCSSGSCTDVAGCCLSDTDCATCQSCTANTCGGCPTCTSCNGTACAPVAGCCVTDDQCPLCHSCQSNACVSTTTGDVGSCCSDSSDCTASGSACSPVNICAKSCSVDADCGDKCQVCEQSFCVDVDNCSSGDGGGGGAAAALPNPVADLFL